MVKVNRTVLHDTVPTIQEFSSGGTVRVLNDLFKNDKGLWQWRGELPKVVPVDSTPESTGGISGNAWVIVSATSLRDALGVLLKRYATVQDMLNDDTPILGEITEVMERDLAKFVVVDTLVPDGINSFKLANGLYAKRLITSDSISLKSCGLVGDGIVNDWGAFKSACSLGVDLYGDATSTYYFTRSSLEDIVELRNSIDWKGATLKLDTQSTWLKIMPSVGNEPQDIPLADLAKLMNSWEGTIVSGWDNSSPLTNSYFWVQTDAMLAKRVGYPQQQNYTEFGLMLRDGNIIGEKMYGLKGNATEAKYMKLESSRLYFCNFKLDLLQVSTPPSMTYVPKIVVRRNQVTICGMTVTRASDSNTYTSQLIEPTKCYGFELRDVVSDAIGSGGSAGGTYGYVVAPQICTKVTYKNVLAVSRWGQTAGDWIKELTVDGCDLNRIDVHFGLGNAWILNSSIKGNPITIGSGDGTIFIDKIKMYGQRTVLNDGSIKYVMPETFLLNGRYEYGTRYRGVVNIGSIEFIVDEYDENTNLDALEFCVYESAALTRGEYQTDLNVFDNARNVVIRNASVKAYITRPVEYTLVGAKFNTRAQSAYREALSRYVKIENLTINDSTRKGYINPVKFNGGLITSDSARYIPVNMQIDIRDCHCREPFSVYNAIPSAGYTSQADVLNAIQKTAFINANSPYGIAHTANADEVIRLKVSVTNSSGSFYHSQYVGTFSIVGGVLYGTRVAGRGTNQSLNTNTKVVSNSEVYPVPRYNESSVLVAEGDVVMQGCTVRAIKWDNLGYGSMFSVPSVAIGNIVHAGFGYSQADATAMASTYSSGTYIKP